MAHLIHLQDKNVLCKVLVFQQQEGVLQTRIQITLLDALDLQRSIY